MKLKQLLKVATISASIAMITACATPTNVTPEGTTDQPVWPRWDATHFDKGRGTFPDLSSLKEIKSGVTKDQLYYLIGRPHYDEVWRPREWNYLFHFHTPGVGTNDVTTCQFKILFDKDKFARSFYWNPVDPIDGTCPPTLNLADPAIGPAAPKSPYIKRYTLSADALFVFDKSDLNNMNEKGRQELDHLAAELKKFDQLNLVRIIGHTDLLGSDMYNMALSQRRAETVRRYLVEKGIPARIMFAYGAGETQPVKECVHRGNRIEYIACLQPNRRVEVEVDGSGILEERKE